MFDSSKFYILKECSNFAYVYSCNDKPDFRTHICPVCGGIDTRLPEDTVMKIRLVGKREGDYYKDCGVTAESIVSPRFVEVLKGIGATGWYDAPIEFTGWFDRTTKKRVDRDGSMLRRFIVTGKSGWLAALSGEELDQCEQCGRTSIFGIYSYKGFTTSGWDGSDIFCMSNWPGVVIVSERVKKALVRSKLKNIRFDRLSEFVF